MGPHKVAVPITTGQHMNYRPHPMALGPKGLSIAFPLKQTLTFLGEDWSLTRTEISSELHRMGVLLAMGVVILLVGVEWYTNYRPLPTVSGQVNLFTSLAQVPRIWFTHSPIW